MKFECSSCQIVFEAKGKKIEYDSHIFGMNWKYMASCPQCKKESDEYSPPKQKKSSSGPSCGGGCGCCH
jgi:hypothetical protein